MKYGIILFDRKKDEEEGEHGLLLIDSPPPPPGALLKSPVGEPRWSESKRKTNNQK